MNNINGLKVVHVSTNDTMGGAAIAARRLMHAQREEGLEAVMLVLHKQSNDPYVYPLLPPTTISQCRIKGKFFSEVALSVLCCKRLRSSQLFALSIPFFGFDVMRHPLCQEADILHLHYTNQGFLSLKSIKKIAHAGKKCAITLHDVWHITALSHDFEGDLSKRFEFATPYAKGYIAETFAQRVFERKQALYRELRPTFVGCSRWMANIAGKSLLSKDYSTTAIPNIPDNVHFRPTQKKEARSKLNWDPRRLILLYGAANTSKGYPELRRTLRLLAKKLPRDANPLLAVFGKAKDLDFSPTNLGIETKLLGYVNDPQVMALYYSASDIFLSTSRTDNLPNTIIEAQLCNCPTISFAIGGIPEIIRSHEEGILIKPFDVDAMATALLKVVTEGPRFASNLGEIARTRYDKSSIVQQYNTIYNELKASSPHYRSIL